jgi:hypothetical protein
VVEGYSMALKPRLWDASCPAKYLHLLHSMA